MPQVLSNRLRFGPTRNSDVKVLFGAFFRFWSIYSPIGKNSEGSLLLQFSFKIASGEFFKILWTDTGSVKSSFEKSNAAFSAKNMNSNLYRILSLSQSELRSHYRTLYSDLFPDLRFWIFISYALSIIKNISGKKICLSNIVS